MPENGWRDLIRRLKVNFALLDVDVFKSRINISNLMSITCKFRPHESIINRAAQTTEQRAILGTILFSVLTTNPPYMQFPVKPDIKTPKDCLSVITACMSVLTAGNTHNLQDARPVNPQQRKPSVDVISTFLVQPPYIHPSNTNCSSQRNNLQIGVFYRRQQLSVRSYRALKPRRPNRLAQ